MAKSKWIILFLAPLFAVSTLARAQTSANELRTLICFTDETKNSSQVLNVRQIFKDALGAEASAVHLRERLSAYRTQRQADKTAVEAARSAAEAVIEERNKAYLAYEESNPHKSTNPIDSGKWPEIRDQRKKSLRMALGNRADALKSELFQRAEAAIHNGDNGLLPYLCITEAAWDAKAQIYKFNDQLARINADIQLTDAFLRDQLPKLAAGGPGALQWKNPEMKVWYDGKLNQFNIEFSENEKTIAKPLCSFQSKSEPKADNSNTVTQADCDKWNKYTKETTVYGDMLIQHHLEKFLNPLTLTCAVANTDPLLNSLRGMAQDIYQSEEEFLANPDAIEAEAKKRVESDQRHRAAFPSTAPPLTLEQARADVILWKKEIIENKKKVSLGETSTYELLRFAEFAIADQLEKNKVELPKGVTAVEPRNIVKRAANGDIEVFPSLAFISVKPGETATDQQIRADNFPRRMEISPIGNQPMMRIPAKLVKPGAWEKFHTAFGSGTSPFDSNYHPTDLVYQSSQFNRGSSAPARNNDMIFLLGLISCIEKPTGVWEIR